MVALISALMVMVSFAAAQQQPPDINRVGVAGVMAWVPTLFECSPQLKRG
jgi:hypothetical protein